MLDTSIIGDVLQKYINGDAAYVGVLTFFVCEAIFNAFPYNRARMKQLTSLIVGMILGFFLLKNDSVADNVLQGLLAGGATTIAVAKFKKPSQVTVVPVITENQDPAAEAKPEMLPEPVGHL